MVLYNLRNDIGEEENLVEREPSIANRLHAVLRKWREGEKREQDYPIFMAMAEHVGYTATGKDDDNDLPSIIEAYRQFKRDHADFF